jgi:hypothetical protein
MRRSRHRRAPFLRGRKESCIVIVVFRKDSRSSSCGSFGSSSNGQGVKDQLPLIQPGLPAYIQPARTAAPLVRPAPARLVQAPSTAHDPSAACVGLARGLGPGYRSARGHAPRSDRAGTAIAKTRPGRAPTARSQMEKSAMLNLSGARFLDDVRIGFRGRA